MSTFPIHTVDSAPEGSRPILEAVQQSTAAVREWPEDERITYAQAHEHQDDREGREAAGETSAPQEGPRV